jgi:iron-sulfur cluster repair protein YtfE (RIC family)
MSVLTNALIAEHQMFDRKIDELQRLAADCGDERVGAVLDDLDATIEFLERELLPHADAEDAVLYPAVARALGSPDATATMTRDHQEIRHLVVELRRHRDALTSEVAPAAAFEVRRLLYALHAIIGLHVAKEEELYVPVLDRALSDDEAAALLHEMHTLVGG